MTSIYVDADLIQQWINTLEFIQGCNNVAVLDPIDVAFQLDAAKKALGRKSTALDEELDAIRDKPLVSRADIRRAVRAAVDRELARLDVKEQSA